MEGNPHLFNVGDKARAKQIPVEALFSKNVLTEDIEYTIKKAEKVRFADTVLFEEIEGVYNAEKFYKPTN